MVQPIKLSVPSHPKYLCLIRKVLQELLEDNELPNETVRYLISCADDACLNFSKHSYEGPLEFYKNLADLEIEKLKKT